MPVSGAVPVVGKNELPTKEVELSEQLGTGSCEERGDDRPEASQDVLQPWSVQLGTSPLGVWQSFRTIWWGEPGMGFKAGDLDEGEAGGWSGCTTCVPISVERRK